MAVKKKQTEAGTIQLTRLEDAMIEIPIIGLTPYIPHRWSEKSIGMMPGHPDREKVKAVKGPRTPKEEADACLYTIGDQTAAPATAFKAALVDACRFFAEPSMVEAKQILFVEGEEVDGDQLVPIKCKTKVLREDTPRNANGNADLRYRYALIGWSALVRVRYVPSRITGESIVALVDAAGRGGIGDWRPSAPKSKTGTYGTWRVDPKGEVRNVEL